MRFHSLAPTGVPFTLGDILSGVRAALQGEPSLHSLKKSFSTLSGQKNIFLCSSGRGAISSALKALHAIHPERIEVAIPAYTSFSVPSAVVHAGFKVRLYDINPETLEPDLESLNAAVGEQTLCLLVCHLFGCPVDMNPIMELARARNIPILDDAAQAMGASRNGKLAGTMGDIGLFSLSRGKNISAVDGGVLVTNDTDLAHELQALEFPKPSLVGMCKTWLMALALCFLLHPRLYWIPQSLPFLKLGQSHFDPQFDITQFSAFQAGLAERMLVRIEKINAGRKSVTQIWRQKLAAYNLPGPLQSEGAVWLRVPLVDGTLPQLPRYGVVGSYPKCLADIPALRPHLMNASHFPGATRLAHNLVTLPTHGYVTEKDIDSICRSLASGGNA